MSKPSPSISALKIWLTGVFLGPVFFGLGFVFYDIVNQNEIVFTGFTDLSLTWGFMILYGGIFSLPSMLLLWFILSILSRFEPRQPVFLATIFFTTLMLTVAPLYVFMGGGGIALAYLGAIWAGVYWAIYRPTALEISDTEEPLDAHL